MKSIRLLVSLWLVLVFFAASAAAVPDLMNPAVRAVFKPALPVIPGGRFDVRHYGAVGDGRAIDTKAVQAAIDAADSAGGGTVVLPAGIYLCGPLRLASHIDLHLEATAILRMLPLGQYPGGTEYPESFISGTDLQDIAITGAGTIDGQGAPWWPFARVKGAYRPRMIALSACKRILIAQVTLRDSPMFHIAIGGHSSQITVRGVTIRAPASTAAVNPSHNTDACDVSGDTALIEDCDVSVGDDNFTTGGDTFTVLIRHCTYGEGHGVSIGSYTKGGVANIAVEDCTFTHTDCGIRIKSDRDRGGLVDHLLYENLRMTDVGIPILIYGAYMAKEKEYRDLTRLTPETAARYPGQAVEARTPVYRDFIFRNITATVQPGHRAGLIWGLPEAPASHILLENVRITADLPFGIYNARGIRLVDSVITTPEGVNKLSLANAQVDISPR